MRRQFRRVARVLLDSAAGSYLKSWVNDSGPARRKGIYRHGHRRSTAVIAYFGESPDKLYQLEQWLPALECLDRCRPVSIVMRNADSFSDAKQLTRLPLVLAETQPDLLDLYADEAYKLAIYVNNSMRNFQSMSDPSIIHVHVDHGESDKVSSISNQLKAYDKVFVAGPAAEERCLRALWGLDRNNLVPIGRPPLDGEFTSVLPPDSRPTVLYAPTWQGENEANNFTSLDLLGPGIIRGLLNFGVRIVYRPHPRLSDMGESEVQRADTEIRSLLAAANDRTPGHCVATDQSIFDLFEDTDVLISDISSVSLDFLYLHTDKGLIVTDRHDDRAKMRNLSAIGAELGILSSNSLHKLPEIVEGTLGGSLALSKRQQLKSHYFGDHPAGSATSLFIDAVNAAIEEREGAALRHDRPPVWDRVRDED